MDPVRSVGGRASLLWLRLTLALDRCRYLFLAGLGALFFTTAALRGRATPFWHDEIYTLLLARLPTLRDIWRAALDGADLTPPLNVLLTRAVEALAGAGPVSSRLPAMLGFWAMSLIVFRIVRSRSNVLIACAAALVPWYTQGYRYSYEARGYGVMLGLFALLLWAWSEAARGHRRRLWLPVFAVAIAATLWNHYFGAVTFAPIAGGELYRWAKHRSPDWALWAAAGTGVALCGPLVPLVRSAAGQSATYWRHASWVDIGDTYWFLFRNLWSFDRWIVALIVAIVVIGFIRGRLTRPPAIAPGHEVVAGIIAVCLPAIAVALGKLTGGFTPRYALSGVVACAIVLPLAFWWISRKSRVLEAVLLVILSVAVAQPSLELVEHPPALADPFAERPKLIEQLRASPPVVVAGPVQFLQLWYYAPADARSRLRYVADPARALKYKGWDTADRGFLKLARWAPVAIETYEQLTAQQDFTLYDDGSGWLPAQLREAGAVMADSFVERGARVSHVAMAGGR